jgi:hypothetical protein
MAAAGDDGGGVLPNDLLATIQAVAKRLNYPGANKLYDVLKREGVNVKYAQVEAWNAKHPVRQIFAEVRRRRPRRPAAARADLSQGKFVALDMNHRWMADLVDLTAQPSISGTGDANHPFQYILVVLNVFSREIYGKALQTKDPVTVLQAFKEIFGARRTQTDPTGHRQRLGICWRVRRLSPIGANISPRKRPPKSELAGAST